MNAFALRLLDIVSAVLGLIVLSPFLLLSMLVITCTDGHGPLYIAPRAGRGGKPFHMIKLRSMRFRAAGAGSTAASDPRITMIGRVIRACKFDEVPQLWNVLLGHMSLVGPRPQLLWAVELYSESERRLLTVRPGITDIASVVFSDEGAILNGSSDPDRDYDRIIRPWKSRLALLGIDHRGVLTTLRILFMTLLGAVCRSCALSWAGSLTRRWSGDESLAAIAQRTAQLERVNTQSDASMAVAAAGSK